MHTKINQDKLSHCDIPLWHMPTSTVSYADIFHQNDVNFTPSLSDFRSFSHEAQHLKSTLDACFGISYLEKIEVEYYKMLSFLFTLPQGGLIFGSIGVTYNILYVTSMGLENL